VGSSALRVTEGEVDAATHSSSETVAGKALAASGGRRAAKFGHEQPFEAPMNIQVRPATQDDAADACQVVRRSIAECCHDDHRGDANLLAGRLRNKTPEFMRRFILAPNAFSVVALVGEEVVGFASVSRTGEVTLCYVAPSARFKGVGKALLGVVEDHVTRAGVDALHLESTRTARAFYLRNGFTPEGSPILAFGIEGQPMRKQLRAEH